MAERILALGSEFGRGTPRGRIEEERVIPETVGAPRSLQHPPRPGPPRDEGRWVVRILHPDDRALEARGPLSFRHLRERPEQLLVVGRIAAPKAGVSSGMDAGGAAERIDDEPGVVGQGGAPGAPRRVTRLDDRVLDEGEPVFRGAARPRTRTAPRSPTRSRRAGARSPRACPDCRSPRRGPGSLPENLAAAPRGSDRFRRGRATASRPAPGRGNACPSAVPWISTNPSFSFMTTFMSVSASRSSA